jgi:hypothetical protein
MSNQTKVTLSDEQIATAKDAVVHCLKAEESIGQAVRRSFTPEVLADKAQYVAMRNQWQLLAIESGKMTPDSARTKVYRWLKVAEVEAPGANAGVNNGNAGTQSAKEAEADAIVAVGAANAEKALLEAVRGEDWSKARRIIDAMQKASKNKTEATDKAA